MRASGGGARRNPAISDATEAARLHRAAGGKVTLDLIPHAPHGLAVFQDMLPEANLALLRIRDWIKSN